MIAMYDAGRHVCRAGIFELEVRIKLAFRTKNFERTKTAR